jgi:tetratricopeptide (TPR) repeat protein
MSKLFDNLSAMEFVMMMMGVIIFLVLVFLLVWKAMKNQPYSLLLIAFLIPIVLVGYPTIQSIKFDNGIIILEKYVAQVAENPEDSAARAHLKEEMTVLEKDARTANNPVALATLASSHLVLGNLSSADSTIKKAEELDPNLEPVKTTASEIQKQIKINNQFLRDVRLLDKSVDIIQERPKDTATVSQVIKTLTNLKTPRYVDESSALVIAKTLSVLNQPQKSEEVIGKVLGTDTGSVAARALKAEVLNSAGVELTTAQKQLLNKELKSEKVFNNKAIIKK